MSLVVRPAVPTDLPAMRSVLLECGLATDKDLAVIAGGVVLVAEWRGRVVGMVQALLGRPCAYVTYLAVLPEGRCKGRTVRKLTEAMERELRSLGISCWLADIAVDDPTWQEAVQKWGARPVERPAILHVRKLA